jgi:vitamin B12 transporter
MSKSCRQIVVLSLCLCVSNVASGTEGEPVVMDKVVVTAGRIAESTKEVSANITVIDREAIIQSPTVNLGDLLAERGLAHIQKYPGSLTSIGIRGFRTDAHGNDLQGHVLILLDGRRAGTGNAVKILTRNIERIEIIRGPGAVQYGSAGMGGIINVITCKGNTNSAFAEAGGGSNDRVEGAVGGTALGRGFDFAGAIVSNTVGDYKTGGGDTFHNTGYDQESGVSLNGGYSFGSGQRLGVIFTGYAVDDAGSPGYFDSQDLDDSADKNNFSVDSQYSGAQTNGPLQWMARYFYGHDSSEWEYPTASNPDGYDFGIGSSNETDQQGAQAQLSATFGDYSFTGGLDYIHYQVENSWSPQETSYHNPALFGLGKAKFLADRLVLTGGLRYDWFTVEVEEPAGNEETAEQLTPQLGLVYNVNSLVKLRAQYGQGFMVPSADQLAIDTYQYGVKTVGNPDLDPETSSTYEAGMDLDRGSLHAGLGYFYTQYEDKIVAQYLVDGSQSWTNLGEATIAGVESELSYDFGELLELTWEIKPYVNLTCLTEYEDDETGNDLLYTSRLNLGGGLVLGSSNGLSGRINVSHYSAQDVEDWESNTYPAPVVELDSMTVADLSASYRFLTTDQFGAYTVRAEMTNFLDEEYGYVKGYPMPGRAFFVSLRWDY